MGEVVNLNRFRKAQQRAAKERAAAENRARSGRTKGERTLEDAEAARRDSELDQAKIEDRDPA